MIPNLVSICLLLSALALGPSLWAQQAETQPAPSPLTLSTDEGTEAPASPSPTDPKSAKKVNLLSHDNEIYVNLSREMERTQREKFQEANLKLLHQELDQRQKELGKIQESLSKEIKKKTEDNENLKLVVTLYESLKPAEAAELLKRLPLVVSVELIKMMSQRKSGKILAAMEPKLAAQISRLLIQSPEVASSKTGGGL